MSQSPLNVVIFPMNGDDPFYKDGSAKDSNSKWINLLSLGQPNNPIKYIEVVALKDNIIAYVNEEGAYTSSPNPHCPYLFGPIVVTKGSLSDNGDFITKDITFNEAKNALSSLIDYE